MCHGELSGRGEGGILSRISWTLNAFSCEASPMVAWFCCDIFETLWIRVCIHVYTYNPVLASSKSMTLAIQ